MLLLVLLCAHAGPPDPPTITFDSNKNTLMYFDIYENHFSVFQYNTKITTNIGYGVLYTVSKQKTITIKEVPYDIQQLLIPQCGPVKVVVQSENAIDVSSPSVITIISAGRFTDV